ncbi:hypothetical protein WJX72_002609 [[Myrmecia] bisecta]|uniref:Protein kinase domain-containing protein n=1 Tax=[Myrmecia] bisecta TaxID=41462 RepID=A0AAW1QEI0_9CHLO
MARRSSSLNDNKVLVATQLKRTASLTCPDLFTFEDHFEFQAVIGRSELSEVYQVRHKHTNELFAVKRSMRKFRSKAHRERCMREIMAVAALPAHPNIVGQYRAWQQGGHFYIQMDLCGGGSLGQLLTQAAKMSTWLPEEAAWQVLYQVSQGLSFLHAHGVLHLDIKPDNIYRDNAGTFKIGDFGLAVLRKQWDWEEGDGNYLAPELLNDASEPSCAADIFSLGATLYECATGEKLPKSGPAREHGQVALPGRSAALQWMIQWMINPDPACRPLAQDVLMQVASLNLPLSGPSDADAFPDSDGGTPATPIASGRTAWQDQDPEHTPVRAIFQASPFSPCPLASPVGLQSPGFALRPALNSDSLDSNGDAWRSPGGGDAAEGGCGDAVADLDMSGSQHDAAQLKATFCDSPVVPTGHRRSGSHPPDRAGSDMHRREHWSRQTVMASLCSFTAMRASPDPGASPPGPDRAA